LTFPKAIDERALLHPVPQIMLLHIFSSLGILNKKYVYKYTSAEAASRRRNKQKIEDLE